VQNATADDVTPIAIQYQRGEFRRTCAIVGALVPVVLRNGTAPGSHTYRYAPC
jgi:hypothetical protein